MIDRFKEKDKEERSNNERKKQRKREEKVKISLIAYLTKRMWSVWHRWTSEITIIQWQITNTELGTHERARERERERQRER